MTGKAEAKARQPMKLGECSEEAADSFAMLKKALCGAQIVI